MLLAAMKVTVDPWLLALLPLVGTLVGGAITGLFQLFVGRQQTKRELLQWIRVERKHAYARFLGLLSAMPYGDTSVLLRELAEVTGEMDVVGPPALEEQGGKVIRRFGALLKLPEDERTEYMHEHVAPEIDKLRAAMSKILRID